jgi:membrane-bound serine protease (ClpP class)
VITALLLLGLGLAFIVAEVLFPSFGLLSVAAAVAIAAAIVAAFRVSTEVGVNFLIATAVLVPAMILVGLKLFPKSPLGKHMVAPGLSFESRAASDPRDLELAGVEGELMTDCRPAGLARLAGRRVDVVSRGEALERGERVRVLEVKGNRVVVARVIEKGSA